MICWSVIGKQPRPLFALPARSVHLSTLVAGYLRTVCPRGAHKHHVVYIVGSGAT